MPAGIAVRAYEAVREDSAAEVLVELVLDVARQQRHGQWAREPHELPRDGGRAISARRMTRTVEWSPFAVGDLERMHWRAVAEIDEAVQRFAASGEGSLRVVTFVRQRELRV